MNFYIQHQKHNPSKKKMCKSEFIKNKIPALWKTLLREKTSHRLEKNIYCIKHIPDKGLVSKIYKELLKFNKKTNNPIKNWQKVWTDTKEDIQMAKQAYGKMLIIGH